MEPPTAFGLASNILTFVNFTCKLINNAHTITQSNRGLSADSLALETVARDLRELSKRMGTTSTQSRAELNHTTAGIPSDANLCHLAAECEKVADDLLEALNKIRAKCPDRTWKGFAAALKEVWATNRVDTLSKRLSTLQQQMQTRLLGDMQ